MGFDNLGPWVHLKLEVKSKGKWLFSAISLMQQVSMADLVNIDTDRSLTSFARDLLYNGFVESADAPYQEAQSR